MPRFLVVQLARFGDLIQTKRLILSLQSRADAEVHLCLDRSLAPLARLVYPGVVLHPLAAHASGLAPSQSMALILGENRRVFADLAEAGFSAVYNLNFSGLNFALAALFDPDTVRGYRWRCGQPIKGGWTSLAFRRAWERTLSPNLADFWAALDLSPVAPEAVNPPAEPRGGGLGVALAGRNPRRSLPPEVLAPVVAAAWEGSGRGDIVLLGTAAEEPRARKLAQALPPRAASRVRDLCGATDWAGLAGEVGGLSALLTPDTGVMHLAAHLGTPVTALFLSSAWAWETGPYGLGHTVWQSLTPCAPCLESAPCTEDLACLRPFADPGFLRALATGKPRHAPPGLLALATGFDPLGAVCDPLGDTPDPFAVKRRAFRDFFAKHLAVDPCFRNPPDPGLALGFYQDRDWMAENPR
jgi:ADP-heptose:LPS heptosyltransferase